MSKRGKKVIPGIKPQFIIRARAFQSTRIQLSQETVGTDLARRNHTGGSFNECTNNYNYVLCTKRDLNYQWKYVRPPVLGIWRKNSKSRRVCLFSLTSRLGVEEAHFFTTFSQCPKSLS